MKRLTLITIMVLVFVLLLAAVAFAASGIPKTPIDWAVIKILTVQNSADINGSMDMNANALTNIGDTGTDFDSAGGLALAGTLDVTGAATMVNASVNGALGVTGVSTLDGVISAAYGTEHIGLPSVITASVPYSPATGTVTTVADGEIWFVHNVFIQTTTNFDCTGDDCTLTVGDGNDADGFLAAADASIQAAFTEATGYAAGFYGIESGSGAAYTLDDGGPFVYAPSGSAETIDYAIGGTDPAAGAAIAYIIYTRIQ